MLYAIIDPSKTDDLEKTTRAILRGGASLIQLRAKASSTREVLAKARLVGAICGEYDVPFIVNDRLDVALACGADGVHLGPDDLPVEAAREIVGDDFVIGASAGTPEAARQKAEAGADYLGSGAVFEARPSKADASAPRGPQALAAIVETVDIPVYGIGGINAENAAQVMDAGAAGVAVIRALLDADDPEAAARHLCRNLSDAGA